MVAPTKALFGLTSYTWTTQDGTPSLSMSQNFPDPSLLEVGGTWYAYSGGSGPANTNPYTNVQVATSQNFDDWAISTSAAPLPTVGKWALQSGPAVWAPDVQQVSDTEFVMYYAALPSDGSGLHCIGAAKASNPLGPFTPEDNVFVCPEDQGGAIDPDVFRDDDGSIYVTYKIDGSAIGPGGPCGNGIFSERKPTPIMMQAVQSDGVTPVGAAIKLLDMDPENGDGELIEAPSIVKVGDVYFMFFASSCYNELAYATSFATATNVTGPWTKAHSPAQNAPFLISGFYDNLPPFGLISPGGLDVAKGSDGSIRVAFHGSSQLWPLPGQRWMYTGTLTADGNNLNFV